MNALIMIALVALFVFVGPVFSIWALNTLFGLGIQLSTGSWFAMAWLHILLVRTK
jgi:hypothetical protein